MVSQNSGALHIFLCSFFGMILHILCLLRLGNYRVLTP